MFELIVLIQGTLRTIGLLARLYNAFVESVDLMCSPSEPFALGVVMVVRTVVVFVLKS
jgi:hypothetical protein